MLIHHFLEQSAEKYPDKTALVCGERRWAFGEIDAAADRLADALIGRGLQRRDRAAIFLENSAEAVMAIFGIAKADGIWVTLNPQTKPGKLEYILNDCQVKILITDARGLKTAEEIIGRCPALAAVILTDGGPETCPALSGPEQVAYSEIREHGTTRRPPCRAIDVDLACLIYTSGSTGSPKGVMLTHLNMISAARSIMEYLENTPDDVILSCLPLAFDYGLYQVLMAFAFGGTVVLEKAFTYPYQIVERLLREKATGFPLVPTMAALLLELKNLQHYDFTGLRYITNTAQALAPQHIRRLQEIFPRTKIYSMYGLTECKRVSYLPPEELGRRPTSVGKAMPNSETYLVDERNRPVTRAGEIGELVVRGANVMRGYWNLPRETEEKLRPGKYPGERVLYTGDLFKQDEEGFLYFIARKDDIIKTAGEMVSPKEVENVLYGLEEVREAAVVGVEDRLLGRAVLARVVLREGSNLTEKDIRLHCQKYLENYMVPKVIEFHRALPKTLTGKIRKVEETTGEDGAPCAAYAEV